jgi:hypothetical protein
LDVGTDSAACGETEGIEETENSSAAPKKSTGVRLGSLALRAWKADLGRGHGPTEKNADQRTRSRTGAENRAGKIDREK